jgi:hypothetical protein
MMMHEAAWQGIGTITQMWIIAMFSEFIGKESWLILKMQYTRI